MLVGERIVDKGGYRGTVRFAGELAGAKGEWLGVEWDDASRGKHDGSHSGQKYFTCRHETGGSFVRAAAVSAGRPLVEVLRRRYLEDSDVGKVESFTLDSGVVVSALGTEVEQANTEDLLAVKAAYMHGTEVSCCGDAEELAALKPNFLKLVDLSNTLLTQWSEVAAIAQCLPRLQNLELSDNILESPAIASSLASSLSRVTSLHLNRAGVDWDQIVCLAEMLPSLEQLHLCQNSISKLQSNSSALDAPVAGFQALRLLNLELNAISDWTEIARLRSLPRLQRLILNDNKLTDVHRLPNDATSAEVAFPSLSSISLCGNAITDWSSIDNLSSYPLLTELRFKDNPVVKDESEADSRQLLIARIPQLAMLHVSPVNAKERSFAEQYYLKRYFADFTRHGGTVDAPSSVAPAFETAHRSFLALLQKHGPPPSATEAPAPKSQKLSFQIQFPDEPDKQPKTVSVPSTVALQALRGMIRRLFRVTSARIRLTYIREEGDAEREMDDDRRPLSYFALASGNIVLARVE
eukprot:scpid53644/ scgid2374/ Tubulin-specific chaperone E; Tubulin-folding cofactor E